MQLLKLGDAKYIKVSRSLKGDGVLRVSKGPGGEAHPYPTPEGARIWMRSSAGFLRGQPIRLMLSAVCCWVDLVAGMPRLGGGGFDAVLWAKCIFVVKG